MEFLKANLANTTTQITVGSNTGTARNIFNRDLRFQYVTFGFDNDATTATLKISFNETTTVDRIALMGMNFKEFRIFYDGVTANVLAITGTSATISSYWTENSETSMYLPVTAVNCTSLSIDMKSTQEANQDKAIGHLIIGEKELTFPVVPPASGYQPVVNPKNVVHMLADGGVKIQNVADKMSVGLTFDYIEESFRDDLKAAYDLHEEFIFTGFGTATGWDEFIFQGVWSGPFGFYKFSDNALASGFSGSIKFLEV